MGWVAAALLLSMPPLALDLSRVHAIFPVDPDLLDPTLLARGVEQHGLSFLRGWGYTPDNWILSLLVPEYPFLLLGGGSGAILAGGVVILALSAAVAAAIACAACRRSGPSLLLAPFLLMPGWNAIGKVGFLGYGVTHTVSLLWGLLAVGFGMAALRSTRPAASAVWATASGLALAINALSDPWADAAFVLPALSTDLVLLARRGPRAARATLLTAHLAALVLIGTRMFGLLGFLPASGFILGGPESIARHLASEAEVLGLMLWPSPVLSPRDPIHLAIVPLAVSLAAATVLAWSAIRLWRRRAALDDATRFAVLLAVLSIAGTMSSFDVSALPIELSNGRFFCNVWMLGPILVVVALHCGAGPAKRSGDALAPFAVLLGAAIVLAALGGSGLAAPAPVRDTLTAFLLDHRLYDGYGPYWGAEANVVTWRSGWRVHLRPVVFDRVTGEIARRGGETSPVWYSPRDRVAGDPRTFVVLAPDAENCAAIAVCETGLRHQFGDPDRVLSDGGSEVWVWDRVLPPISAEPK